MTEPRFGTFFGMRGLSSFCAVLLTVFVILFVWQIKVVDAKNISTFSDTLSDSAPLAYSNHTIKFTIDTDVSPGGSINFVPPTGFSILATSTFTHENVELYVNGVPRVSSTTADATTDGVTIVTGSPGSITYTFNSTTGVTDGDVLSLRIGDHTSLSTNGEVLVSTSTGTTTLSDDIGIENASTTGSYAFTLSVTGGDSAYARFWVALVDKVDAGPADTRETIPPLRFNGNPTGNIGGTTLSVEISLETNEFAICKFDTVPGTSYNSMPTVFANTGIHAIVHSHTVSGLLNGQTYNYYVRCIDDENNFNTDDYVITFTVLDIPDGTPNTVGSTTGDGTGSGDDGTGTGTGTGGQTGSSGSSADTSGSTSGGGGSGGGGGGGSGGGSGSGSAGGLESSDDVYPSGDARVIINGYAFPRSTVYVLVDGKIAQQTTAGSDGKFSETLDEIARGVYTFGVYAVDTEGTKSSTFSTSFSVQGGKTSTLSNVNVMPSIKVTPDPVDVGQTVTFSGFSIPNADITIENQNDKSSASLKTLTTTSDGSGAWTVSLSTSGFSRGTYKVRAKAEQDGGVKTSFSDYTYYGVGQQAERALTADLNVDGRVNLTDFSILLFWWNTDGGPTDPPADINQDGDVSLTDFSIMLFNWTG